MIWPVCPVVGPFAPRLRPGHRPALRPAPRTEFAVGGQRVKCQPRQRLVDDLHRLPPCARFGCGQTRSDPRERREGARGAPQEERRGKALEIFRKSPVGERARLAGADRAGGAIALLLSFRCAFRVWAGADTWRKPLVSSMLSATGPSAALLHSRSIAVEVLARIKDPAPPR